MADSNGDTCVTVKGHSGPLLPCQANPLAPHLPQAQPFLPCPPERYTSGYIIGAVVPNLSGPLLGRAAVTAVTRTRWGTHRWAWGLEGKAYGSCHCKPGNRRMSIDENRAGGVLVHCRCTVPHPHPCMQQQHQKP